MTGILLPRFGVAAAPDEAVNVSLGDLTIRGYRYASIAIVADGFVWEGTGGPNVQSFAWITPQLGMDQYEVMASYVSQSQPDVGSLLDLGQWRPASSSPWLGFETRSARKTAVFQIHIRKIGEVEILASAQVTLQVG